MISKQNKLKAIGEWREQNSFDSIVNIINGDPENKKIVNYIFQLFFI